MKIEIDSFKTFFNKYKGTKYENAFINKIQGISTFEELNNVVQEVNSLDSIEMFKSFQNLNERYKSDSEYISNIKNELLDYYKKRLYWQYVIKNAMSASIKSDKDNDTK